jgi:hypothetical protein
MGAAPSNNNTNQQVEIIFIYEACGASRWSYAQGSPIPPLLAPYMQVQQWEAFLNDVYAATQPVRNIGLLGVFLGVQFFIFMFLGLFILIGLAILIGGGIYMYVQYQAFLRSLREIQTKYQPQFQSFATFEFNDRTRHRSGREDTRNYVKFQFTLLGGGGGGGFGGGAFVPGQPMVYPQQQPVLISVTIPPGVYGGQSIIVQGQNGTQMSVVVPAGMQPGQSFNVAQPMMQQQPMVVTAMAVPHEPMVVTATVVSVSDSKY